MPSSLDWLLENEPLFRKSRLPSLYSDLSRQKDTNPEGFAANLQAWLSALTRAALAGKLPSDQPFILQTSDELLSALASPQYGRPSGLGAVIDEAVRQGKMVDLNDFTQAERSIYSKSWIPSPWAVLRWSLQQAGLMSTGSYNVSGRLRNGNLVLLPALEDIDKKITAWQSTHSSALTDRIFTTEAFSQELSKLLQLSHPLSPQSLSTLLLHLQRDRNLLSYNTTTIKLNPTPSSPPPPITQEDTSIANLTSLINTITSQITHLEITISTQQSRATSYLAAKNKPSAVSALRSKKRAEFALMQRQATLNQLEDVYASISQAADQIGIVETLQSSAQTLKALNKQVGDVEKIEDVIDTLKEEMGKTEEVGGVLREDLRGDEALVEMEVDEELERMEQEEREKVEAEEERTEEERLRARMEEMGSVPSAVPGTEGQEDAKEGEGDVEAELATSTEELKKMSLADRTKEGDQRRGTSQEDRRKADAGNVAA